MKKLILSLAFISSFSAFAAKNDVHFDRASEINCQAEAVSVGCAKPEGKNDREFSSCVDSKLSKMSAVCHRMYKKMGSL